MHDNAAKSYRKATKKVGKKGPAATTMESMQMEAERKKKAAAMMVASRMANPKTVLGG